MATDLERLTVLIEANTKSYERAMIRLQKQTDLALRGASKSIKGLDASMAAASRTAATFAKAFGAGILVGGISQLPGALRDMVKSVADLGDEADRLGITAERLQELNFQAEQTGVSAETMAAGLEVFGKRVSEAQEGSGELLKLFQANNIALKNSDGTLRPFNDLLSDFVDLIGNAANAQDRLNISAKGFGKGGGADLALTFAGGSAAMREFADQAHRLAQIMTNETVKSAQEVDDKFAIVLGTISQIVKSGAVDAFQDIADEIDLITARISALQALAHNAGQTIASEHLKHLRDLKAAGLLPGAASILPFPGKEKDDATLPSSPRASFPGKDKDDRARFTVIPLDKVPKAGKGGGGGGRKQAADDTENEKKQVVELIAELERERSLIGATDEQRRISNELRSAGAAATEEQKQKITDLVIAIDAEQTAQAKLVDTLDEIRDASGSALDAFVQSIQDGEGPLKSFKAALVDMLQTIIRIGEQQAITSLFGAFGTPGGGILAGLLGKLTAPSLSAAKASSASAPVVQLNVVPGQMFVPVVTGIAGNVSVQHSKEAESRAAARAPALARQNSLRFGTP